VLTRRNLQIGIVSAVFAFPLFFENRSQAQRNGWSDVYSHGFTTAEPAAVTHKG
jgi:hypothetical protein